MIEIAERIFRAALEAVKPEKLIRENIVRREDGIEIQGDRIEMSSFDRIYLVSFGKAARAMAEGFMGIAGDYIDRGIVVSPEERSPGFNKLRYHGASHPLPDKRSVRAGQEIISLAEEATERDLVIVLISGGGSSLVCLPADGLSLEDKKEVTEGLLRAGADIRELNAVRKHLSGIKGGRLAGAAFPASVVSLVISDVIGNDLESIASGPTFWDSSTFQDAGEVLKKYKVWEKAAQPVKRIIEAGMTGQIEETLKKGDPVFSRIRTYIVGDNLTALQAAKKEAGECGLKAIIMTASDQGEARAAAKNYVSFLNSIACSTKGTAKPLCFLAGGELTVTVKGKGKGGRNTEFVLAAFAEMVRQEGTERKEKPVASPFAGCGLRGAGTVDWLVASLGTDGRDGPTNAAGAWAGPKTCDAAGAFGLDPESFLGNNDSYTFFEKTGGLIITGPTDTNVMDIRLFILAPPAEKKACIL